MKMTYSTTMKFLIPVLLTALLWACKKDDVQPEPGIPTIQFSAGEYKVKKGKALKLSATVENAVRPLYSWKLDGKIISTDSTCDISGYNTGEYFVTLRVDAENGTAQEQVKVSVLDKLPPEINMSSSMLAYVGEDTKIKAEALYAENASFVWRLNGVVVGEDSIYTYNQTAIGPQTLSLRVVNEDGEDLKIFTVTTLPKPVPELFFDNGRYRTVTNSGELRKMTVPLGSTLVLAPVIVNIPNPTGFVWKVNGATQSATTEFLSFTPAEKGVYTIAVTEKGTSATGTVEVTCTEPENTYFRSIIAGNKATATKGFDYVPAPGQFINYQIGSTQAKAMQDLQRALDNGSAPYIGAYGGYWIVGFDHSVKNEPGKADLRIDGNAFAGWSEPGIVWVMQDDNGNGLPDDTWYELKGSESGKPTTKQRYAITYYKPKTAGSDVLWTDNVGRSNTVDYNGYHSQAYYFPMFITEDYYTLVGTCLESSIFSEGGIVYARDLPWGYVDNYNTDASRKMSEFWIEDAIQVDGTAANLKHIDFVKVHTGMAGKGAAVGEISTEPGCPTDMNFNAK